MHTRTTRGSLPDKFAKPTAKSFDWETLVFGLESDRFKARDLFSRWLDDAVINHDAELLQRLGNLMGGAYHSLFGGRLADAGRDKFYDWLLSRLQQETNDAKRKVWVRGLSCCPRKEAKALCEELQASYHASDDHPTERRDPHLALKEKLIGKGGIVGITGETGHVPADHVHPLYVLSSLAEGLGDIYFEQAPLREKAEEEEEIKEEEGIPGLSGLIKKPKKKAKVKIKRDPEIFREAEFEEISLDALGDADPRWIRLRAYRAGEVLSATIKGNGDYRDAEGVVGFMNNILQYCGHGSRVAVLPIEDEGLIAVVAPKKDLIRWRDAGVLSFGADVHYG